MTFPRLRRRVAPQVLIGPGERGVALMDLQGVEGLDLDLLVEPVEEGRRTAGQILPQGRPVGALLAGDGGVDARSWRSSSSLRDWWSTN